MLKKPASGVLASLRGSTLRQTSSKIGKHIRGFSVCQELWRRANGFTKCSWYLLASSLTAALLDSLFEHPARLRRTSL
jgi:hypothetical protein